MLHDGIDAVNKINRVLASAVNEVRIPTATLKAMVKRRVEHAAATFQCHVDKSGNLVPGLGQFLTANFDINPQNRRLYLQNVEPSNAIVRKVVTALKRYYPDIEDWEVRVTSLTQYRAPGRVMQRDGDGEVPYQAEKHRKVGHAMRTYHSDPKYRGGGLPKYVYHGTSTNAWLDGINRRGLLPRDTSGAAFGYDSGQHEMAVRRGAAVYFSIDPDSTARAAAVKAAESQGGLPLIIRVDTQALDVAKLVHDEDAMRGDDRNKPIDWRKSINAMAAFGYRGSVPRSSLRPVQMMDKVTGRVIDRKWIPFDAKKVRRGSNADLRDHHDAWDRGYRRVSSFSADHYAMFDAGLIGVEIEQSSDYGPRDNINYKQRVDTDARHTAVISAPWRYMAELVSRELETGQKTGTPRQVFDPDRVKAEELEYIKTLGATNAMQVWTRKVFDALVAAGFYVGDNGYYVGYYGKATKGYGPESSIKGAIAIAKKLWALGVRDTKQVIVR